jgi:hypothetical protein
MNISSRAFGGLRGAQDSDKNCAETKLVAAAVVYLLTRLVAGVAPPQLAPEPCKTAAEQSAKPPCQEEVGLTELTIKN